FLTLVRLAHLTHLTHLALLLLTLLIPLLALIPRHTLFAARELLLLLVLSLPLSLLVRRLLAVPVALPGPWIVGAHPVLHRQCVDFESSAYQGNYTRNTRTMRD